MEHFDNAEHMMEVQGGAFVKALVHLWYCADPANKPIVRKTFSDYFKQYEARFEHYRKAQQTASQS